MRIISNENIGKNIYLMRLEGLKGEVYPFQFFMFKIREEDTPLLRRPFSVHNAYLHYLEILYKVRGKGTELLSRKKQGDYLDVVGPLGKPFLPSPGNYTLIAGGMGIAPLLFLAKFIKGEIKFLVGCKSYELYPVIEKCKDYGKVFICTEDGSLGEKGVITDFLEEIDKKSKVIACGPIEMLKKIKKYCEERKIKCYLSLERRMGCGIGACKGCAVKAEKGGYYYVCKDGPVFESTAIRI